VAERNRLRASLIAILNAPDGERRADAMAKARADFPYMTNSPPKPQKTAKP